MSDEEWLDKHLNDGIANESSKSVIAEVTEKRAAKHGRNNITRKQIEDALDKKIGHRLGPDGDAIF